MYRGFIVRAGVILVRPVLLDAMVRRWLLRVSVYEPFIT